MIHLKCVWLCHCEEILNVFYFLNKDWMIIFSNENSKQKIIIIIDIWLNWLIWQFNLDVLFVHKQNRQTDIQLVTWSIIYHLSKFSLFSHLSSIFFFHISISVLSTKWSMLPIPVQPTIHALLPGSLSLFLQLIIYYI